MSWSTAPRTPLRSFILCLELFNALPPRIEASKPPRPEDEAGGGRGGPPDGGGGGGPDDGGGGGPDDDGGGGGLDAAGAGAGAAAAAAAGLDDDVREDCLAMCLEPRLFVLRVRREERELRAPRGDDRDFFSAFFFFSRATSAELAPPPSQCSSNSKKSRRVLEEMWGLWKSAMLRTLSNAWSHALKLSLRLAKKAGSVFPNIFFGGKDASAMAGPYSARNVESRCFSSL